MDVKKNIKKYREQAGYKQEYVAGMLGITQQAYQQIETGDTKVTAEFLARLAVILHVRVEEFYGVEPNHQAQPAPVAKELLLFEKLVEAKDQLIATKDKVIQLQESILAKTKSRRKYKRA